MTPWNMRLINEEKDYNNPLILEKIIDFYDIDEIGSNYPKEMYNPHEKHPEDFFEEVAKRQAEQAQA
jgi:hypothetical protein